jgi:hypothetical protein
VTADLDALRTRLTTAGQRWANMRATHTAHAAEAQTRLNTNRAEHAELVNELTALAHEATDAGMSENETAALLGVSRARTLRRWLGK